MTTRLLAYVGSRTTRERNARGEGISIFAVDRDSGALDLLQVVGDLANPSFLALNRAGDRLYCVHGDQQEVSAFRVLEDGALSLLNRVSCQGRNPVHLALDPKERSLLVSNHLSGTVAVLALDEDGGLQEVSQLVSLPGAPGPHRIEQPFSKPHFNPFDPSGRFVLVPDKGLDRIFSFRLEQGKLTPAEPAWVDTREGAGPRNLAFHPRLAIAYAVNELDCTVTTYAFDQDAGGLRALQVLSVLPDTFTGNSRAAGIAVSADGRFVYASSRGCDGIAAFAVDPATGCLHFQDVTPSGGRTPRFFALAPSGRHLYALNEDSDTIVRFAVDAAGGRLAAAGAPVHCGSPVCMVFRERI
jgi:6-phosphogluconolactonase (cycloisomerase 2 family)